jgi:predicted metal-dependent phosphoesterase TrpH
MGGAFDLHLHTNASDGLLEPGEVVRRAAEAGLIAIAVTDHDTTGGVERAQAEGTRLGLPVIAGAEFSADSGMELHILGYGMDIASPAYLVFVEEQKARRRERNARMLARLSELGFELPDEYMPGGVPGEYGRKHMALGMESAGYVTDTQQAFDDYLSIGAPAYVKRRKFTAGELIAAIRASGGQAVLAHPGRMGMGTDRLEALVNDLHREGLAGIEAFYPSHSRQEAEAYRRLAEGLGLVCTYGSDWHGYDRSGLAHGFHEFVIPQDTYDWLNALTGAGGS